LVVIDQLAPLSKRIEAGKQVVVMGPRAAVKNDCRWALTDTALEDAYAADIDCSSSGYQKAVRR
jgi:hypothetical protein